MKLLCLDLKWKTQKTKKRESNNLSGSPLYFVKNERGEERFLSRQPSGEL
jgi:hypothetical protein